MPKAAIFDLDGTLVDMFDVHLKAFQKVIKNHHGLDFTQEDLLKGYGQKAEDIARIFFERHSVTDVDYEGFARERAEIAEKNAGKAKLLPGVPELLKELKDRGIKIALATSCRRNLAARILGAVRLRDYFDAVVTAEDVTKGKPHPGIFLRAAEKLRVKPGNCVVFEDSLHGIRAGRSAGMRVVAVTTGKKTREEQLKEKPDIVVDSLKKQILYLIPTIDNHA